MRWCRDLELEGRLHAFFTAYRVVSAEGAWEFCELSFVTVAPTSVEGGVVRVIPHFFAGCLTGHD